jgi:hypothetical protein
MQAVFPEERGEAAEEGNAVHWMCAEVLSGRGSGEWIGRTAPNGILITADMKAAGIEYVEAVSASAPNMHDRHIEEMLRIPRVHPECFGTPDHWAFIEQDGNLFVDDLKYGFSLVEAEENAQLITYTIGILDLLPRHFENTIMCHLRIIQPRAFHPLGTARTWRIPATELRTYANLLESAAAAALGPAPVTAAGKQCHYCRARHACEAASRYSMWAADYAGGCIPQHLTPKGMAIEIGTLRRAQEIIKHRLTGLETAAIALGGVPGWAVERGPGRLTWVRPVAEVIALGELMGVSLGKPPEPITPTQAIKAGLPADVVGAYADRPNGEAKLVPVESTRAARVFGPAAP